MSTTKNIKTQAEIKALQQLATISVTNYLTSISSGKDGHIVEHVAALLSESDDDNKFDQGAHANYHYVCLSLLALLANPKVCRKLKKEIQPVIGPFLLKMVVFFERMGDESSLAALSLHEVKYSEDAEDLVYIEGVYKNLLEERQFSNKLYSIKQKPGEV